MALPPDPHWRPMLKSRLMVAAGVLVLWAVGIQVRLIVLQVVQHDQMVARADRQQMSTVIAADDESAANPRARSAKLRAAERVAAAAQRARYGETG